MYKPTFYAKPKLKLGGTWRHICFPNMSSIKNNLRSAQVGQATAQKWPGIVKPWTCEPLRKSVNISQLAQFVARENTSCKKRCKANANLLSKQRLDKA